MKKEKTIDIIHFAGGDGVGKSTLVKAVSKKLNFYSKHFDKPLNYEDGKKQYFDFLNNLKELDKKSVICDRLHDGEWIYAPLYRNYTGDYMREFERELINRYSYLLVYVKADLQTIVERTRRRGEDFVKEEHFQKVLDSYDEYMYEQALPYIEIDTTSSDTNNDVDKIISSYRKSKKIWEEVRIGDSINEVIKPVQPRGNINGDIMIVGQNPGGKGKRDYSTTWCAGATSRMLMNVTKKAGIFRDSWFTNLVPYPTDDNSVSESQINSTSHILKTQIDLIQPKVIIALGNIVHDNLVKSYGKKIPILKSYHPSYVQRFMSNDVARMENYIDSFKRAKKYL